MGSTETKYFPVHIDYNTMIKIKELNTWTNAPVTWGEYEGNLFLCGLKHF